MTVVLLLPSPFSLLPMRIPAHLPIKVSKFHATNFDFRENIGMDGTDGMGGMTPL